MNVTFTKSNSKKIFSIAFILKFRFIHLKIISDIKGMLI